LLTGNDFDVFMVGKDAVEGGLDKDFEAGFDEFLHVLWGQSGSTLPLGDSDDRVR
jgi:hypothetical protein